MTVMDKVEGWNNEECVGSKFAACMWQSSLEGGRHSVLFEPV